MNPARFFTIASLLIGAAMIILTPPFCTPDEPAHLYRAWSIGEGRFFVNDGDAIPRSVVETAAAMLLTTRGANTQRVTPAQIVALARRPLRPRDRVFVRVVDDPANQPLAYTARSYTPVGYAVSALVVAGSQRLELSPVLIVYLVRVFNLIVATLIIAFAIARAPFGRWAIALIALTPMAIFMRASAAIDALTIAFAIALIVAILRAHVAATLLLTLLVCAIKPGYLLLPLLIFAVPQRRRRGAIVLVILAIAAGTAATLYWAPPSAVGGDVHGRSAQMLHQPFSVASDTVYELVRNARLLTIETVADFGWLDAPAPLAFAIVWLAGLTMVALLDGENALSIAGRVWMFLLFCGTVLFITIVIHLSTASADFLRGLQGRYFLPALPLFFLPMCTGRTPEETKRRLAALLVAIAAVQSGWTIFGRYWI